MQIYEPGTEIGQYRILSAPMMGGMGVVYACHDLTSDRAVALKTFKPEYLPDREARERFLREASAWVRLGSHPNIVRCYGVEYLDPITFLALEFILKAEHHEDASLSDWIGAPMPPAQALPFALQIARGMLHATQKLPGFVHRDLKPDNILVGQDTLPGTNIPRLRVTDFGLVYFLRDVARSTPQVADPTAIGQTHLTQACVGTPLYMAPEQWMSGRMGVFTDVYAFGCILYEMLTGQRAASAESLEALAEVHCSGGLRPIPGDLPIDLGDFLRRCIAIQGSERYETWQEVIAALEEIGSRLGVSLPPVLQEDESIQEQRERALSFHKIGSSYHDMGNARTALGYYEKALAIFRTIGDRRGEGGALNNLGISYAVLGERQRALGYFNEALEIARKIGDQAGDGNALNNLGNSYDSLGQPQRAIGYFEEALAIFREIGNRRRQGDALGNLGASYKSLGDARRAIGYFEEALAIFREIGDRRGEGSTLGNLGNAYQLLGDTRRASEYYEKCLNLHREIGDRRGEGRALGNLGVAYRSLGDVQRAIGHYKESLAIAREIGDQSEEGVALQNLGNAYGSLGDARRATEYIEESLTIARAIGDRRVEGMGMSNLGVAYKNLGDMRRALGYFEESLAIAREIGDRHEESKTLGNLASTYSDLGDAQRAIGYYQEAVPIRHEIGDIGGVASSLYNMALLYARQGANKRAMPMAQEAERIWTQIGSSKAQQAHQLLAHLHSSRPASSAAENSAQAAFDAFLRTGSFKDMQSAVTRHTILKAPQFHADIEQFIREQVQRENKPAFEQRLTWLKQITDKKNKQAKQTGFFGRLFGKKKG